MELLRRDENLSGSLDWTAILLYVSLVLLGWINIYAAVFDETLNQPIWDIHLNSGRQLLFMVGAAIIVMGIIIMDMRFYETFAYLIYGVFIFLLLLVPFIGKEVGGNKAWLGIGSFGVQPSEFAKFATALAIAKFVGSVGFRIDNLRNQAILFAMILLPLGLIVLQKDAGTALVFTAFVLVFFREGMSPFLLVVGISAVSIFILTFLVPTLYLHIAVALILIAMIAIGKKKLKRIVVLVIGAVMIVVVINSVNYIVYHVLKPHQQNRIKVFVNPDADPLGDGWNVTQSKIAIGSGRFLGKGFLQGTQTKFDFVPEQSTDFIFCTIGEEHGWIGSFVVITLFVSLLLRVIFLAERQKNRFARAFGYSVACIFFFHFAVNIGLTVGLFPVIGIPLPFFSYGGSSLWGFTILLFVLLKFDAHRGEVLQRV